MSEDRNDLLTRLFSTDGDAESASARPIMVVAAHPDDETIGAGGQLRRLRPVAFVHVTDGAPIDPGDATAAGFPDRPAYAAARRQEFFDVLAVAGIMPDACLCLGLVDQQAAFQLDWLTQELYELLTQHQPEAVLTHAYEGGHPDHDATALAVHTACRQIAEEGSPAPAIVEMTGYHNEAGQMAVGRFLPSEECPARTLALSEAQQKMKRAMVECYATQRRVLGVFPLSLERFRIAPRYDFRRLPHSGVLFYEMSPWGMTGPRWQELAGELLDTVQIRDRL